MSSESDNVVPHMRDLSFGGTNYQEPQQVFSVEVGGGSLAFVIKGIISR